MNELANLPGPLTLEEERTLLAKDRQDPEVRNKLLLHELRAAIYYASGVARGQLEIDELMSLATDALLSAIKNYKAEKSGGIRLIQYAKPYLRSAVRAAWRFREPVNYKRSEIPERPIEEEAVIDVAEEDPDGPDYEAIDRNERWAIVKPYFDKVLTENERRILLLIFESRLNMAEIARMLKYTREAIRITKVRALKKIRLAMWRDKKIRI